ncbi:hypothetical protein [Nocardia australiensis]|uniref:hypothetical protein n=1 Tax=Nocardia australiensis TaxID=2887191 RepID=UPI001D140C20|nr:hypothetical protein [Nocardia australiensis]
MNPKQQWKDEPLKTDASQTPIPIPRELALLLSASVKKWPGEHMVTRWHGQPAPPWHIDRALRAVRNAGKVQSLPEEFSFHDFRHYFASLLISKKADIKDRASPPPPRQRQDHARHLRAPVADADESTRTAIGEVIAERMDSGTATADELRTEDQG